MTIQKTDFKKTLKSLYNAPAGEFVAVEVPAMQFVKVDGKGNPNNSADYQLAVEWLYSVSYAMKFAAKAGLEKDYVVPPLEGLWWADDYTVFQAGKKEDWKWTMMIMVPDFITQKIFDDAVKKAGKKLSNMPESLRLEVLEEGLSLQTLHIGSYDDEGPVLDNLHKTIMPERKCAPSGLHHEIYLSDPRKTDVAKLKTILRQPVKPL